MNSRSYYDVSNDGLDVAIETMKEQHKPFIFERRECDLLHETYLSLPSSRLEASPYDDCESFLPLESNLVDDVSSTDLEKVFDPPLTSLLIVAPFVSVIPIDTISSDLILLTSPLHLAQCVELEMSEPYRGDTNIIGDVHLHG